MNRNEAVDVVVESLRHRGLTVRIPGDTTASAADITLDLHGRPVSLAVKAYALVDRPRAEQLARALGTRNAAGSRPPHPTPIVVGDRIVAGAQETLRAAGVSWLDLRGHLYLAGPTFLIDAPTRRFRSSVAKPAPWSGRVGLAVAVDILLTRPRHVAVREVARRVGAAPSSVSATVKALRNDGLVDDKNATDLESLFWATANAWKPERIAVSHYPHPGGRMNNPSLRLGLTEPEVSGWALAGDVAAAHLGAPIGLSSSAPPDFYLPSRTVLRLARSILDETSSYASRRATIALPPVPAVCEHRVDVAGSTEEHWVLARPLFVALDLAQDQGRGREILSGWNPEPWGTRVW